MLEPDLFLLFVRPLNEQGIRYTVCGSIAAMLYGEPRFTQDIDMMALVRMGDVTKLRRAFPDSEYYREGGPDKHLRDIVSMMLISGELIDRDVLREWVQRKGVVEQWRKVEACL